MVGFPEAWAQQVLGININLAFATHIFCEMNASYPQHHLHLLLPLCLLLVIAITFHSFLQQNLSKFSPGGKETKLCILALWGHPHQMTHHATAWQDWAQSKYKQLIQYAKQDMFGHPMHLPPDAAIFNWVWTYLIKTDGTKKACGVCDSSSRAGKARTQDYTYASCVEMTGLCLFHVICSLESLMIYGADASNTFAEAPPPHQKFYM